MLNIQQNTKALKSYSAIHRYMHSSLVQYVGDKYVMRQIHIR
jgi:hypothetical protein